MTLPHSELADLFMEHAKNPFHRGRNPLATRSFAARNPTCGDEIHLQLQVDGPAIISAWFEGKGCVVSQAAASMLCEELDGKPLDEVSQLSEESVLQGIGVSLSPVRRNCALLAFRALKHLLAIRTC